MPLYDEFDRYYEETQRGQKVVLQDPAETIQSKLPVPDGEVILTQTRLYVAVGDAGDSVPNVRLERAAPRAILEERFLELAPRLGARLGRGQTAAQFLQVVEMYRNRALDRRLAEQRSSREGHLRRYDALLARAGEAAARGDSRRGKDILRSLHAAVPGRTDAAARLGRTYLEEGNARAAVVWLARGRVFDSRFDTALGGVERPRLPSREVPPPEWWLERHLTPLLDLPEGTGGPDAGQRERIRAARRRIEEFRAARGRASPAAWMAFVVAVGLWIGLLFLFPWPTLGVTAAAAVATGLLARRSAPRRPPRR